MTRGSGKPCSSSWSFLRLCSAHSSCLSGFLHWLCHQRAPNPQFSTSTEESADARLCRTTDHRLALELPLLHRTIDDCRMISSFPALRWGSLPWRAALQLRANFTGFRHRYWPSARERGKLHRSTRCVMAEPNGLVAVGSGGEAFDDHYVAALRVESRPRKG
jgi:hypothetical protein